jgi:hypothetical protein
MSPYAHNGGGAATAHGVDQGGPYAHAPNSPGAGPGAVVTPTHAQSGNYYNTSPEPHQAGANGSSSQQYYHQRSNTSHSNHSSHSAHYTLANAPAVDSATLPPVQTSLYNHQSGGGGSNSAGE